MLDEDEVRRVAELARLELSDAEVDRLAGELDDLLQRLEELRALDPETPGPPEPGVAPELRLRPDAPPPEPLARGPEAFAPEWREGFFVLPRVAAMEARGGEDG